MQSDHSNNIYRLPDFCKDSFCIYGAGIIATSIYTAIRTLYNKKPLFFLVSDAAEGKCDENPLEIDGITVKRLSEWKKELQDYKQADQQSNQHNNESWQSSTDSLIPKHYLIVTPEVHQPAIVASLRSLDVISINDSQITLFTNDLENEYMEAYYSSLPGCNTVRKLLAEAYNRNEIKDAQGTESNDMAVIGKYEGDCKVQIYQAKCHVDRPLQNPVENPSYIYPIQVGAALTDLTISELRDNTGENISYKNRNYCELTATYYAWKNSHAAYKGLCHYRRIFDISDAQMQALMEKQAEWDVILPYPTIHYPNISTQHIRYINDSDWKAMQIAIKETVPEYFEAYNNLISSGEQYFYNFNMLIARADIFDDYCDFLFKVLKRAEELTIPKGADRADRFAGYMGENLTTLYFHKNREKLNILYSGKAWLT